jgi:hypothetical protein
MQSPRNLANKFLSDAIFKKLFWINLKENNIFPLKIHDNTSGMTSATVKLMVFTKDWVTLSKFL